MTHVLLKPINPSEPQQMAIAARFRKVRPIVPRKSTAIEGATWREVSRFSGVEALNFLNPDDVRASVRLADELFLAYDEANTRVDATLLYYGCMWLALALVYAKTPTVQNVGHGMGAVFGNGQRVLLDARIDMRGAGRIHLLSSALAGSSLADPKIPLIDVLRVIPELDSYLSEMGEGGTTSIPVRQHHEDFSGAKWVAQQRGHYLIQLGLGKAVDLQFLQNESATLAALADRSATLVFGANQIGWAAKENDEETELRTMFMVTSSGEFFMERLISSSLYVPELVAHLIILHALSTLARYYPKIWLRMVDDYTPEYHLIREFIDVCQSKFPILVLNELSEKSYVFE